MLAQGSDELLNNNFGTEKERMAAIDDDKIEQLLLATVATINELSSLPAGLDVLQKQSPAIATQDISVTPFEFFQSGNICHPVSERECGHFNINDTLSSSHTCKECQELYVVFGGSSVRRTGCVYHVCGEKGCDCAKHNIQTIADLLPDQKYILTPDKTWDDLSAVVIPGKHFYSNDKLSEDMENSRTVGMFLFNATDIPDTSTVKMSSGDEIISRVDEDELCTVMRRDIKTHRLLMESIVQSIATICGSSEFKNCSGKFLEFEVESSETEKRYFKQKNWRKIATNIIKGVRDQRPEFNIPIIDAVPASWSIKVQYFGFICLFIYFYK